jgi:DNA helicase-2/ATP-dependent DNA helicase PcrA
MPRPSLSPDSAVERTETIGDVVGGLADPGRKIVGDELAILQRVHERLVREANNQPGEMEDLDATLIELRDAIAEAKEEDVPSLIDQMHQVAALSRKRGQGRSLPIDPKNPYFGHLRLRERRSGRQRDVLIGRHTLLDDGDGVTIVDWRNAPVSRLYYRYEEEDDYEEDFDDRTIEGSILVRRSLAVTEGELRRVAAPQGTWAIDREGRWRQAEGSAVPTLQGGSGSAIRYDRSRLGVNEDAALRADKHLQEITALIDKQQFELITRPESGIVLIQGGAGSGKTTVALHRVAYLAFQDAKRFAPQKMIIVVFNDALVEYIRHVLPSLGVDGVTVTTYRRWSSQLVKRLKLPITLEHTDDTPDPVVRFKKHPVVLRMIDEVVAEQLADVREELVEKLEGRSRGDEIVAQWDELERLPPVTRVDRLLEWLAEGKGKGLPPKTRAPANTILRAARDTVRDVVADFLELNTAESRIRAAIATHAAGQFSDPDIDTIVRWCAKKAELEVDEEGELPPTDVALDEEDDAILLRLLQVKFGGLFLGGKRFEYEHLVLDEAQDLCPLEVRVLLDCVSAGKSVTIAGDRAQKMIFDNGFVDWPQLLGDAGLPHVEIQPLKITYRSTRQVMELSRHVLGPLHNPEDDLIARDGAPVGYFEYTDQGEAVAFLGEALRGLMQREPSASVALIARYPQQADMYYDALRIAEVPRLRRVRREDFSFTSGIDVTDVRQVKGLEFDYVVILDPTRQNYPDATQSRHLMHIAMTRAAFQLWLICAGETSPLLPGELFDQKG